MKKRLLLMFSLVFLMSFGCFAKSASAEGETAEFTVSRADGLCTFTVSGLTGESKVTVEAVDKTTGEEKYKKEYGAHSETPAETPAATPVETPVGTPVGTSTEAPAASTETPAVTPANTPAATPAEISGNTLTAQITLADLNYVYGIYSVTVKVDGVAVGKAKDVDFSIHSNKMDLSIAGESYAAKRTFSLNSTESAGGVLVPGTGNKVSIRVWKGKTEKDAEQVGKVMELGKSSVQWKNVSIASVTTAAYGTWNAKVVLKNSKSEEITLAASTYEVETTATSLLVKKTAALEKNQEFRVLLKGAKSPYGVNKVALYIYNSANKKIAAVAAAKSGSQYQADIKYETVKNKLEKLTIKAVIYDNKGKNDTLSKTAIADLSVKTGKLKVKKNKDVTCDYTLTGAYIPGNIQKLVFVIYVDEDGDLVKKKTYLGSGSVASKKYSANAAITEMGTFTVVAYGYTAWGKRVQLASKEYTITKKDMGKQGWYYEKVNGITYKFYYKNNVKVTDLTSILGLTKNGSNKMYIEVNRAACVVTFYLYDEETKKYDIPIKSAAVSVGRDTSTVAGAGALNINSSFSPIGTFSICSNGAAVKYTLKPMHEPDGSTVYARWCSHIVGNVYFHAIAVGSQSHYAVRSYAYNRLGSPASAGCIRMTVADAKWLYDYAPTGTTVKIVVGNSSKPGPYGKPGVIKINGVSYDPTDPEVPDATKKADYKAKKITGYMTKDGVKVGY